MSTKSTEPRTLDDLKDTDLVRIAGMDDYPTVTPQHAQAELTRRLMESMRGMNTSTSRYSDILIILTIMLMILGMLQLMATILRLPDSPTLRFIIFTMVVGFFVCAGYFVIKDYFRDKK